MKVYHKRSKSYIEVDSVKNFSQIGRTETHDGVRCAVMKKEGSTAHYLVPYDSFCLIKVKGEKNISAKLKTSQVRQMIVDYHTQKDNSITIKSLAEKYKVSAGTISGILNGKSWCHVSIPTIRQIQNGNTKVLSTVSASNSALRNTKLKLNENMAKFIVRDYYLNKFKVKDLAVKFCVSVRSIQRIVSGQAWSVATLPAIAEFKKPKKNSFGLVIK